MRWIKPTASESYTHLKPGNIMITKAGAKVLDFGLAKYAAPDSILGTQQSALATEHKPITQEGTILGTIQYMSPEQLEGKEADPRTDIFALGAVLYEMATGKHAFQGNSKASLIASIMQSEPAPMTAIQPMTPPALDRIVRTCLEKDPDERLQSAHDVARELKWISESGSQPAISSAPRRRIGLKWLVPVAAFVLGSMAMFALLRNRQTTAPQIRFTMAPPELLAADDPEAIGVAVSPDGRSIAFSGKSEGKEMIFVRSLQAFETRAIPQTEDGRLPFWSPDSRNLGFFAYGKLKKVSLDGGGVQTIADAPFGRGGAWSADNVILFSPDLRTPFFKVSAEGGRAEQATELDSSKKEVAHRWPSFLPNGRDFLFHVLGTRRGVYSGSLDSREHSFIVDGSNASYVEPGMLLYVADKALLAHRFDARKRTLSGNPVTIADDVGRHGESGPTGFSPFSASSNGVIAFRPIETLTTQLAWYDSTGKELGRIGPPGVYAEPTLAPDGSKLAVNRMGTSDTRTDLWTVDLARGTFSRITYGTGESFLGVWSPDGKRLAFTSDRAGSYDLYEKAANGSGPERLLYQSPLSKFGDDWSSDGRYIIFEEFHPKTKIDLWLLSVADLKPIPYLVTPFDEAHAQFSRDSRFVAYSSNESGTPEVYVQPVPATGQKWQISSAGGDQAFWGRDGKSIFYVAPERRLMKVELELARGVEPETPTELFQARIPTTKMTSHRNSYIVGADGKRFLITEVLPTRTSPIHVIVNWRP